MPSKDETIAIERGSGSGRLVLPTEHGEAELTWHEDGEGRYVVDHTFTPPKARGRNIAERLSERMAELAREEDRKIVPRCPYVAALAKRRSDEWSDVLAER